MNGRKRCPICGQWLRWVECQPCHGRGSGADNDGNQYLCYFCGGCGGWWECPGEQTAEEHLALIRRERRRAHLLALLAALDAG